MKHPVLIAFLLQGTLGCFPTRQAQYQYGAPTAQFQAPVGAPAQAAGQPVVSAARVAAAGKSATGVIRPEGSAADSLFGSQVALEPFTADGYNKEAGGPVNSGPALTCNFDGKPCCWANVPSPEDQLDWQIATGAPNDTLFKDAPAMQGSYLMAYARGAAPSDEAQFTSCSIGCSSSPITVRAKHWQSNQVLLQVCLRDSFPNNVEHNPLLHCQELPPGKGLTTTEVVLPKTSLVDIIFVASDFTSEQGDIAILDDIEVSYDNAGPECQSQDEDELQRETANSASHKQVIESSNHQEATLPDKATEAAGFEKPFGGDEGETHGRGHGFGEEESGVEGGEETAAGGRGGGHGFGGKSRAETGSEGVEASESDTGFGGQEGPDSEVKLVSGKDRFGESGFRGGATAFGKKGSAETGSGSGVGVNQAQIPNEETLIQSIKTGKKTGPVVKGAKTKKFSETICQSTKCDFENGNTCSYKDAYQEQSIRGITTKFEVTEGQFKNRVTGVKESSEGDFYAATFLYPREKAGLEAVTEAFTEKTRMRFRYYEGTHGVQLKGCCGTIENCPFSSDKFVSVSDRTWKTASFKCPKGTDRVIFLCENTRTNQGACAVDDIGMVESDGSLKTVRPLC